MTAVSVAWADELKGPLADLVAAVRPFSTGHNARLYLLDLKDGRRLVAKAARAKGARLSLEGWMLNYLAQETTLPVPRVHIATDELILMDYVVSGGPFDHRVQSHAAGLVAALHNITADRYGFGRDTLIGPFKQPNPWSGNWVGFFRDWRLLYAAEKALREDRIDRVLMRDIEKLAGRLEVLLDEPEKPSLVHGDMWGGNILAHRGQVSAFIDPALYFADAEIELAFTTLFGTFDDRFFSYYREIKPIRPGFFEVRRDIYNLYPLLVHARLFGGGYADSVRAIVSRFV